ncbi:hypothetical protein L249_6103 [Ophiocordyceps polyrhachis-furcata BCC 54312]|uniref:UBC core domain-containing protein n=1 Tax=Ophiocordyceps polyrhachis-furcata BCC 54312 TaxID=1330021 RepID=A0A367LJ79_9HYPO|nr:hypothetical protein L249_6103 [Ophiocordyceps polyrhachis-furcata BCC 54312]
MWPIIWPCPPCFSDRVETLSRRIPGDSTVGDAISFLSQALLAGLINEDDSGFSDSTGDSLPDFHNDFDFDNDFDNDFDFGFSPPPAHSRHVSQEATKLLKQSLRKAHSAGLRIGILPPVPTQMPFAVTLSIQVKQLGLPDDAQEAWDLTPDEYLVLVCRPLHGYPSLSTYLDLPLDQKCIHFRFGKCATAQPSYSSICKAMWNYSIDGSAKQVECKVEDQGACLLPNHMSASINRLLNSHLHVLLSLRRRHQLSWTSAQEMMQATHRDPRLDHAPAPCKNHYDGPLISLQAPMPLQRDGSLDDDVSIPLVAMQLALRHFVRCTDFCTVCYGEMDASARSLKPYSCANRLCLYQHLSLGFGATLEHQIVHHPYVVDLLLSFFYTAVYHGRLREFPAGLALKAPMLEDLDTAIECDICLTSRQLSLLRLVHCKALSARGCHFVVAVMEANRDLNYYACCVTHVQGVSYSFNTLSGPHQIELFDTSTTLNRLSGRATNPTDGWNRALIFPTIYDASSLPMRQQNLAFIFIILALPSVLSMRAFLLERPGEELSEFGLMNKSALSLAEWILASNRSHLVQDQPILNKPKAKLPNKHESETSPWPNGHALRFRFAQGAPDKERYFMDELQKHGNPDQMSSTLFAWHGSPLSNWHSIVRSGLDFQTTANGRSFGHGVYMSQSMDTSLFYTNPLASALPKPGHLPNRWPNSDLQPSKALSLVEVINRPDLFVSSSPHYVVDKVNWIQCRYLYVEVQPTAMAVKEPFPGRQVKESQGRVPQDRERSLLGKDGKLFVVPREAIPACRRIMRAGPVALQVEKQEPGSDRAEDDKSDDVLDLLSSPDEECEVEFKGSKRLRDGPPSPRNDERPPPVQKTWLEERPQFHAGSLDHRSLPKLPAPSWADSSPQALKALGREINELHRIQKQTPADELGWSVDVEKMDNLFHWIVELHSFDADLPLARDMREQGVTSIVLEMRFGANFPLAPPFVRVIRPRFLPFAQGGGGHITAGGAVCSEMLTLSGWLPTLTMEKVMLQVRLGLCDDNPPARLLQPTTHFPFRSGDYGVLEAVEAYRRAARVHGWVPSPDLEQLAAMGGARGGGDIRRKPVAFDGGLGTNSGWRNQAMRIVESQSAVLTNYEVFQHLVDQRRRYKPTKRRGPGNLETVVKEVTASFQIKEGVVVLVYMRERPSPLGQEPATYSAECISQLLERLRPYDLSKGEVIMMFNHRPPDVAHLNTLVEDMSDRFTAEQQQEIVDAVADILGGSDDDDNGGGDVGNSTQLAHQTTSRGLATLSHMLSPNTPRSTRETISMSFSAGRLHLSPRLGPRLSARSPRGRCLANPSDRTASSGRPTTDANIFMAAKYESWTRTGLIKRLRALEAELQLKTTQEDALQAEQRRVNKTKGRRMDRSRYSTRYIALKLAYLGKRYGGFEFQAMSNQPTIEEELWTALTKACLVFPDGEEEVVQFDCCEYSKCGRTDRGVSAFGQVVGLRVRSNRPVPRRRDEADVRDMNSEEVNEEGETPPFDDVADELCYPRMLNRILPRDIRVLAWCPSPPDGFSARFSCRERQYRYFFTQPAFAPSPQLARPGAVPPGWLDLAAMRDAAKCFEGEHDFRNFCKVDPSKQITNFCRNIYEADIVEADKASSALSYLQDPDCINAGNGSHHPKVYYFLVRGSAFLWHQIRHMVAVLFLVGQGLEKPSVVSQLLDVEAQPSKPTYAMADEVPLVLWDCVFPDGNAYATNKLEDSLRWVYVGDEQVGDKFGPFGVMDSMWRLYREHKMDELLAHQLLQQVARRGPTTGRGRGDDDNKRSVALFEGGNGGRLGGKYVPVMEKSLTQSPEEQNEKYAKRKGYASAEEMRAQKAMGRGRETDYDGKGM